MHRHSYKRNFEISGHFFRFKSQYFHLKFIYSEKATKIGQNSKLICLLFTKRPPNQLWDFVIFLWPSQNILMLLVSSCLLYSITFCNRVRWSSGASFFFTFFTPLAFQLGFQGFSIFERKCVELDMLYIFFFAPCKSREIKRGNKVIYPK